MATTSDRVTIPVGGVEYIRWTLTGLSTTPAAGTVTVSFDGSTWNALTINSDGTVEILVAHPSVTTPPAGSIVVPSGMHYMQIKFTSTPELVIRPAGTLIIL